MPQKTRTWCYLAGALATVLSWYLLAAPSQAASPAASLQLQLSPSSIVANGTSTSTATATVTDNKGDRVAGDNIVFSASPSGPKFSTVADNGDGTYTASITTTTVGPSTITATDTSSVLMRKGSAVLTGTPTPPPPTPTPTPTPTPLPPPTPTPTPPPSNISPPGIFGIAAEGQTLTEAHGSWTNNPTAFDYQWEDCDSAGSNCVPITGATNPTYTLTAADLGHTIAVQESATSASGTGGPVRSARTAAVTRNASTTMLTTSPSATVTNQRVTLIAAVTSSASNASPSGVLTFEDGGAPIGGCVNIVLAPSTQSTIITCQASFAAFTSPERLTAVFTPDAGSSVAGSTSATDNLIVSRDSTSTSLDVSNPTVNVGTNAKYTATVTPSHTGSVKPSGSVEFLDGGKPITSCVSQPLESGGAASTATCTVSYKQPGTHLITAFYGGDRSFGGSSFSPAQPVSIVNLPPRVLGTITSTMQWSFYYTPTYTTVLALVVNGAPTGATVLVTCHGQGCPPLRQPATAVTKAKRCTATGRRRCPAQHPGTIDLMRRFSKHRLHAGAQITVEITQPGWIGKHYLFTTLAGHAPRIRIACLAPGSIRPGIRC